MRDRRNFGTSSADGIFRDVGDLMLEDEKVGRVLAGEAHHAPVVVFNPAAHHLAVHQLDAHRPLLLAQHLQISRFLVRVIRRRSSSLMVVNIS